MDTENIDFVDLSTGFAALCVTAYNVAQGAPLALIPAFGLWGIFAVWRRSVNYGRIIDKAAQKNKYLDSYAVPLLLPANNKIYNESPEPQPQQLTSGTKLTYRDKLAAVSSQQPVITNAVATTGKSVGTTSRMAALGTLPQQETRRTPEQNMQEALSRMPKMIMYNNPKIPDPPTPMSVLVGYAPIEKRWIWADFEKDTIHTYIGGQTRAGKDTMIRMWFTQLTMNNTPDQLQFIVIDGKGEWTLPALMTSAHMAIPPVGGFKVEIQVDEKTGKRKMRDLANDAIEDTLIETIELLQKRMEDFNKVGALNLNAYYQRTGIKLPLLMLIVTDVSTNLQGLLEQLIIFLVTKGGSIGVRAIISMQTSSGEDTTWRGQMGMSMSGYQAQSSADAPNLGMAVRAMKYRPSQLPSSDYPENRGLFVVRKGIQQYLVRGAYLPDEVFMNYCATTLPKKKKELGDTNAFLGELLALEQPKPKQAMIVAKPVQKQILTKEKALQAVEMAKAGVPPSTITKVLGYTSADRYAEAMPVVQNIVTIVKQEQRKAQQR